MTGRRERLTIQVFITSLVVGGICFVFSYCILVLIGLQAGLIKLIVFGPPPHPRDWPETLWIVVMWVGSLGISGLSSWAFFRYAKRFITAK
jgi:hypothetical protein